MTPGDSRPAKTELIAARGNALPREVATVLKVSASEVTRLLAKFNPPDIVLEAGGFASYAYAEFFSAEIENANTRRKYRYNVDRFLTWLADRSIYTTRWATRWR